jgi:transcriptional regulator with XRE-family HTH domain
MVVGNFNKIKEWLLGDPDGKTEVERRGLLFERNISIEKLARAAGLTREAVYLYIRDKRRPRPQAMERICDALGVPHEEGLSKFTPSVIGRPSKKK